MTDPRNRLTLRHMHAGFARPGWHYRFPNHNTLANAGYDWRVELRIGEFAEFIDGIWLVWFKSTRMLAESVDAGDGH